MAARVDFPSPEAWIAAEEGIAQCDMDEGNFAAADAASNAHLIGR